MQFFMFVSFSVALLPNLETLGFGLGKKRTILANTMFPLEYEDTTTWPYKFQSYFEAVKSHKFNFKIHQ